VISRNSPIDSDLIRLRMVTTISLADWTAMDGAAIGRISSAPGRWAVLDRPDFMFCKSATVRCEAVDQEARDHVRRGIALELGLTTAESQKSAATRD